MRSQEEMEEVEVNKEEEEEEEEEDEEVESVAVASVPSTSVKMPDLGPTSLAVEPTSVEFACLFLSTLWSTIPTNVSSTSL